MKHFFTFLCMLTVIPLIVSATVINVPADQPTIQAGINAAVNGDTVLVADSTYYENINFKGKTITVASLFLIDGDTTHIDSTIINGSQPSHSDSGSVVYFVSGEDTNSVLCGFTISGGSGTVRSNYTVVGGGIYTYNSGALICNNTIKQNEIYSQNYQSYGGGIVCRSDTMDRKFVHISDNTITHNQALSDYTYGGYGGGIDIYGSDVCIENNDISYNQVSGGAYCYGPGVRLVYSTENSFIKYNSIKFNSFLNGSCNAGGLFLVITRGVKVSENHIKGNHGTSGAGLFDYASKNNVFNNNIFVSHTADSYGGGIMIRQCTNTSIIQNEIIGNIAGYWGAGIFENECINTTISENILFNNSAGSGAGIETDASVNTKIINNVIIGNTANGYPGGGIAVFDSHAKIIKNLISDNNTTSYGGGLAIGSSSDKFKSNLPNEKALHLGGMNSGNEQINHDFNNFYLQKKTETDSQTVLINNTITNNIAAIGGGIYNVFESTLIVNTILYGDSAISDPEIYNDRGIIDITYSNVQDSVWQGIGNISADPLFADSLFHLGIGSPCIDAGHPSHSCNDSDLTRNDMGCYGGVTDSLIYHLTGLFKDPQNDIIPGKYVLSQNYPNPFNPTTTIEFSIPKTEFVTLKIYNILGQEVATLVSEKLTTGNYKYNWNGGHFASGIYFSKLEAGDPSTGSGQGFIQTRKLILLR